MIDASDIKKAREIIVEEIKSYTEQGMRYMNDALSVDEQLKILKELFGELKEIQND